MAKSKILKYSFLIFLKNHGAEIVSIVALFLVFLEFRQIRLQNEEMISQSISMQEQTNDMRKQTLLLDESLKQSYRPLLVVDKSAESIDFLLSPMNRFQKWMNYPDSLLYIFGEIPLINKGEGPLVYHGSISFLSHAPINFRAKLLNDEISHVYVSFDGIPEDSRSQLYLVEDVIPAKLSLQNINAVNRFFIHDIFLYSDIEGNLYDTYLRQLHLFDNSFNYVGDKSGGRWTQFYHSYDAISQRELCDFLEKADHNLKEFVCQNN